jgi:hypothetical protein
VLAMAAVMVTVMVMVVAAPPRSAWCRMLLQ